MKIIKPSFEIIDKLDEEAILRKLELCGRVCYKSEDKIKEESAEKFVKAIIERGHESVLEHVGFSVRFIVDRGVSHEIVRHRIASFSQESTRYCNYGHDDEITVIEPFFYDDHTPEYAEWFTSCRKAEAAYMSLLIGGSTPQEARSVLPNSLKTDIVMTANLREWRHFIKLRTAKDAHPQMREIAIPLLVELKRLLPTIFFDYVV